MLRKIKNFIEWGCIEIDEIIEDKELFYWFYCDDDIDYTNIKC